MKQRDAAVNDMRRDAKVPRYS